VFLVFSPLLGLTELFSQGEHGLPVLGEELSKELSRLSCLPSFSHMFLLQKWVEDIVQFDRCDAQVNWLVDAGGGERHHQFVGGLPQGCEPSGPGASRSGRMTEVLKVSVFFSLMH